ncbi:MAG: hypothetical protein WDZ91_12170 [Paenibacillaceae bacterium]
MRIHITDPHIGQLQVTPSEWADEGTIKFDMNERVVGVPGEAFDFMEWYEGWRSMNSISVHIRPTHLRVTAVDEFTALIPWGQLKQAAIQYAIHGEPLTKGYPIRLYVPNGTSDCLNVKGVVHVELLYESDLGDEAAFGFKNQIKLEDMFTCKGE